MKRWTGLFLIATLSIALLVSAQDDDYVWNDVERVVAVGDVHGSYDNLVRVLRNARLIDEKLRWIGGEAHLVQNGDVVDRGPDSRKAMDFLMKLEERAEDEGGRVHLLIGNHEAMNLIGILDLVSKQEYAAFVDRDSRKRHEQAFDRYYDQLRKEAKEKGEDAPKKNDVKAEFTESYPLGYIEHRRAFDAKGRYGKWIRRHNTAVLINGVLFSHGDWSEKFADIGIAEVNDRIRKELSGELPIEEGLTFDEASPLQYRGLANTSLTTGAQSLEQPRVDRILEKLGAKRLVVGHTLTPGWIEARFGGKLVSIDVGMLDIYRGGHRVALELVDDQISAIHDDGVVPIPDGLDETNLTAYIREVAAVDPTNVDVQLRLVDSMREAGELVPAATILERLFETPEHVPFRYRDVLGAYYANKGEAAKAETQYLAYIEGLSSLVEKNANNQNLANLLARYCVDKNLELDRAFEAISAALESTPDNYSFRITKTRVELAKGRHTEAIALLDQREPAEGFAYDAHFYRGLAYKALGARAQALEAFEAAIKADPTREEAAKELSALEGR